MASRPLGKPSFLEQVRAMKQACEESMVKDGSEVRPPTRVVPEDFKLWRTISLPMDQPVDEAALVRLREIYNAMQHLGVHMLACLDNTLPPELFKHIGVDHPPALLKKAIYEFLNNFVDYETKKAGLVRNVPFVKNGPGSGFALIEQFFAEKYNPNGAEVQLLADALHVSEQEVKDWFAWKRDKLNSLLVLRNTADFGIKEGMAYYDKLKATGAMGGDSS